MNLEKKRGFTAILPLLLLVVGLVVSVIFVGQRTSWVNRAAPVESPPNACAWKDAAKMESQESLGKYSFLSAQIKSSSSAGIIKTIEANIYANKINIAPYSTQILNYSPPNDLGWVLQIRNDGKLSYSDIINPLGGGQAQNYCTITGISTLSQGVWYHVAVSKDMTGIRLFLNGKMEAYSNCNTIPIPKPATLGIGGPAYPGWTVPVYFNGLIEEVRISSSARYLSNFSKPAKPFVSDMNTMALWHFDQPNECNALTNECFTRDSSGKGNHAKIVGNVQFVPSTLPCATTGVTVSNFTAKRDGAKVILSWATATEINNAGFNVLRSNSSSGVFTKVNSSLIPPKNFGSIMGTSYSYTDTTTVSSQSYYFKLEALDNSGSKQLFGPVSVPALVLPTVSCNNRCGATIANCSGGLICSAGYCRNSLCTGESSCNCPQPEQEERVPVGDTRD